MSRRRVGIPLCAVVVAAAGFGATSGCGAEVDFGASGAAGGTTADGGAAGTGNSAAGSAGQGGSVLPCGGIDCSTIEAPPCKVGACNTATNNCAIVDASDGSACDDGLFCTSADECNQGECMGSLPNDCGIQPGQCSTVVCFESSDMCSDVPANDGAGCTGTDLCVVGTSCSNGSCTGGSQKSCEGQPVPNDCHVSLCDSADGQCKPVPGNFGQPCADPVNLCTVNKTCNTTGFCAGGTPKDCSALTQGCVLGMCNSANGMCTTTAAPNGQPCNDQDACTVGDICMSAACTGTPITQCVNNDGCCPATCSETTDTDCGCNPSDPVVSGKCQLTTVCGTPPPQMFCGGNCSSNTAQFADWWCQLAGYTGAFSYTEHTSGVVQCLYYDGQTVPLTSCSQVQGPATYGLATFCTGVDNLLCNP